MAKIVIISPEDLSSLVATLVKWICGQRMVAYYYPNTNFTDADQFPCQVSIFLLPSPTFYITWGFVNFNASIPNGVDELCSYARVQCDFHVCFWH